MRAESAKQIAEMQAKFILQSAELQAQSIIENAKRESERILAEALKREEELDKREEELEDKLQDYEEKQDEYKQATKAGLNGILELVKDKIGITPLKGLKKETTEEKEDEEIEEKNTTKRNSSFADDIEMEVINKEETKQPAQEQPKKVDLDFVLNNLTKEEAELLGLSLLEKFPDLAIEPEE